MSGEFRAAALVASGFFDEGGAANRELVEQLREEPPVIREPPEPTNEEKRKALLDAYRRQVEALPSSRPSEADDSADAFVKRHYFRAAALVKGGDWDRALKAGRFASAFDFALGPSDVRRAQGLRDQATDFYETLASERDRVRERRKEARRTRLRAWSQDNLWTASALPPVESLGRLGPTSHPSRSDRPEESLVETFARQVRRANEEAVRAEMDRLRAQQRPIVFRAAHLEPVDLGAARREGSPARRRLPADGKA